MYASCLPKAKSRSHRREWLAAVTAVLAAALPAPGATFATNLWPGGVVPYWFDDNVYPPDLPVALAAMAEWEAVAAVEFRPRSGESDFIHIRKSSAQNLYNISPVGRQGGQQVITIHGWFQYNLVHQLGHCLGWWHEQQRPDRDGYVQVNDENISQTGCGGPCDYQFEVQPAAEAYGPYDFESIMHSAACAYSCCPACDAFELPCSPNDPGCRTITVLPPNDVAWQDGIGQRDHLSFWDQRVMSFLYPYAHWRFVDLGHGGGDDGTFFDPYLSLSRAIDETPDGGMLWVLEPDPYSAIGVYSRPMTWRAGYLAVTMGG